MRSFWPDAVWVAVCLGSGAPLAAQARLDVQVQAIATAGDREFAGAGLGAGVRAGPRTAVRLSATAGRAGRATAGRAELLGVFDVNPAARRGAVVYAAAGVAAVVAAGEDAQWIVLALGLAAPRTARLGWFVEGGVGGGLRAAAGVRLRPGRRP